MNLRRSRKKLKEKLLACFDVFNYSYSSADCPYKDMDRTPEFYRWLEGGFAALDPCVHDKLRDRGRTPKTAMDIGMSKPKLQHQH